MSHDLEDRLRAALHAVPEAPVSPDAFTQNLQRVQARRRRSARATLALAAAAAVVGVLAVPALDLGQGDTLRPASPGVEDPRPDGEVVETWTAVGRSFDLIWQEGRRDYRVCTSQPPHACASMPVLKELSYTGVAVPVDDGAVLLFGSRDNPEVLSDDLLVTGQPGADPLRPVVEFVESRILGYRLAVFKVPTLEPAYCVAFQGDGRSFASFGVITVNGAEDVC